MKKKTAVIASALLLLTVGGVTALNAINPSWRENTIFCDGKRQAISVAERARKTNRGVDSLKISKGRKSTV